MLSLRSTALVGIVSSALACAALALPIPASSSQDAVPRADDWVPSQIQPTDNPLAWSRATLGDQVTLDEFGRRPVTKTKERVWVLACEREIQLDCVESVSLVHEDGTVIPGEFLRGVTFDVNHRVNEGIAPYAEHDQIWSLPGLVIEGSQANVQIAMAMGGEGPAGFPGLNMMINLEGVPLTPPSPSDPLGCRFVDRGQCLNPPVFPDGTVLRIVTRTSWVAPSAITVRGTDVETSIEPLGTGARRITISGSPMMLQSQGGEAEIEAGRPQWVTSSFDFSMFDPRLTDTPGGNCTVDQPIIITNNAQGSGLPTWDSQKARLDLRMQAPHFWADGKTEWLGYYETTVPGKVARCLWGVDPEVANYLSVSVYDDNGEEKAATTAVSFRNGFVKVRAYGFTFSENTVAAKVKVKAGQRCFKKGVRLGGFVCQAKGKKLFWVRKK